MSVILNMLKNRDKLSESEKIVFDYLIDSKGQIESLLVEDIAKKTYTSTATVVRMCQKLGYKGFIDFKNDYLLANAKIDLPENIIYNDPVLYGENKKLESRSVILNNIIALEDTLRVFSEDAILNAATKIMVARRILIFGKGSSYLAAMDLKNKLRRIDKQANAYEEFHELLIDITFINSHDVLILISDSGETKEILNAALIANEQNAKVISIVRIGNTSLKKQSEINLFTSALEGDFRSGSMTSRISQMSIVDALYVTCAHFNINKSKENIEKTHFILKRFNRT